MFPGFYESKRFGLDLFKAQVSTFAPTDDGLVPDTYRLGVGDELNVQLYGKDNEQFVLQVGRSGEINFPKLGAFTVAGLTFDDAKAFIKTRVEEQFIGVSAVVTMGRLRAINIFIAGEVAIPGAYSVSALTTVTQALFQAGGITEIGALRSIEVRREGRLIGTFDAYDLLLRGDMTGDIRLSSGDVVFVPAMDAVVEVTGAVRRAKFFEVLGDETLEDVIFMAGGLEPSAFKAESVLYRFDGESGLGQAMTLDLTDSPVLDMPMLDGDRLYVPEKGRAITSRVTLSGAVNRPGDVGWRPGLRVSDLLGDVRRDLRDFADLSYSLVVRQENELLDVTTLQFSLADAIAAAGTAQDPLLNEFDEILVFSQVRSPSYELEAEMSLRAAESESDEKQDGDSAVDDGNGDSGQGPSGLQLNNGFQAFGPMLNLPRDRETLEREERERQERQEERERLEDLALERDASRVELLKPVIEKLITQARENEPVRLASVSGAVRQAGMYPVPENGQLSDLIAAAGGLTDAAFLSVAELRRLNSGMGGRVEASYVDVSVSDILAGTDMELVSRDHLTIREVPDWSPNDAVTIRGEVRFPGEYRIRQGERLSDVIERAGGFTDEAFLEAAIFTRESIATLEKQRAEEFARNVQQTFASRLLTEESAASRGGINDLDKILEALNDIDTSGRLLINLPGASGGDLNADIELENGDSLIVPIKGNTVSVIGEVLRAGTHTYQSDLNLDDYLDLSAGLSARADTGGIYVIKANGGVDVFDKSLWRFNNNGNRLDPGDTIVVPINTQYKESLTSWNQITQIIYQSMVSIAAVANL
jgi:protein involved in polysaccharide export with SLBB domain